MTKYSFSKTPSLQNVAGDDCCPEPMWTHACGQAACGHCGARKGDVQMRVNPYLEDVEGETVLQPLCDKCAELLADEI